MPYPIWKYYPSTDRAPAWSVDILSAFEGAQASLDSTAGRQVKSDEALAMLRPTLLDLGFQVEGGKSHSEKIRRPVLFGELGVEERAYEVDAFHTELGIAMEVEAGRGTQGNAIYRDLIQSSLLLDADYLVVCLLLDYKFKSGGRDSHSPDYAKARSVLDAIFASNRLKLPFRGVLLVGY